MSYEHDRDRQELRELRSLQNSINARIDRLEKRLIAPNVNNFTYLNGVNPEALKPYIQQWIDGGHTLLALADRADLSETTIRNVLMGKSVREDTADKLITALGVPHKFDDVVPPKPPDSQFWED